MSFETPEKSILLLDLLMQSGVAISKGEAKRAIREGLCTIDGEKIDTKLIDVEIKDGMEIEVRDSKVKIKVKKEIKK